MCRRLYEQYVKGDVEEFKGYLFGRLFGEREGERGAVKPQTRAKA